MHHYKTMHSSLVSPLATSIFHRHSVLEINQPNPLGEWSTPSGYLAGSIAEEQAPDRSTYKLEIRAEKELSDVQIRQSFSIDLDWKSYVIAPGAMYDGNRFVVSPQPYCPYLLTEGVSPEGPIVQADIPRLSSDTSYYVEYAANALTIPAIGIYDPLKQLGCTIRLPIYGDWGVTGVNIKTLPGRSIEIEITLPVRREKRYRFCDWISAEDTESGVSLLAGQRLVCPLTFEVFAAPNVSSLVKRLADIGFASLGSQPRVNCITFEAAAESIERKYDDNNWDEAHGFYWSGLKSQTPYPLQTGWVGGGAAFYAMTLSSDSKRRARARRMIDFICRGGISPSGYFHGMFDGKEWRSFGVKRSGCRAFSLIRRPMDCTLGLLKSFAVFRERDESIEEVWHQAARSNLNAAVATVEKFGHLGYTVDFDTGDILWGDSTCGAFGIEPLVRGYSYFGDAKYLQAARKLAEFYVGRFLHKGYTCGGVGDALMAVDSESCYALLSGLVHLHEITHEDQHLEWAREAGYLFATWVLWYDADLPASSPLGSLGIQARGAVFANTQNSHGAPGICVASGAALLMLFEQTGEEIFLRMVENIAQCIPQMIVKEGQEHVWGELPPGSISERLMSMDGMERCGATARLSTFAELSLLLTVRELPKVYRSADKGMEAFFDASPD